MRRSDDPRDRRAPRWLLALVAVVAILVPSGTALAVVSTRYAILGAEVWATPTVGTFVGGANGSSGDVASWAARIEHTVQTQPGGKITGGWATLYTSSCTASTAASRMGRCASSTTADRTAATSGTS